MASWTAATRLAIAVLQTAIFTIGLSGALALPASAIEHAPTVELAWLDDATDVIAARRPPRWPGRSKGHKGLAIREAAAFKPLERSI